MIKYCMTVQITQLCIKTTNNCTVINRILNKSEWTSWTVKRGNELDSNWLVF